MPTFLRPINRFFVYLGKGLSWGIGKLLLKPVLKIYFWGLKLQKIFHSVKLNRASKYLIWSKKYIYKGTVALTIIIAFTNNIMAQEINREEYGSQTMMAKILSDSPEQAAYLVKEGNLAYNEPTVTNYLEDQGVLQNDIIATPFGNDDIEGFLSITQGDSALIAPSLNDPEVLASRRDKIEEHIVQPGETISTIAQEYGVSSNTILWENNLTWSSTIKPGQKLTILPTTGISHTVKSGETVSAIANKYKVTEEEIVSFNKLANASDISVGEKLIIPDGIKPSTVQQVYKPTGPIFKNIIAPDTAPDAGGQFLWPVLSHRMTQYYSWSHAGVDIGDHTGNPIYAAENGEVIRAGWTRGYGYNVVIDHGNGITTLYGHASELLVEVGQSVSRGQTIALVGSTGWSTGPHLHLEVKVNGRTVNPLNYIK